MSETVLPEMVKAIKKRLDKLVDMELNVTNTVLLYETLQNIEDELDNLCITDKRKGFSSGKDRDIFI